MVSELERMLYAALKEAIEWDWMDEISDPPNVVVEQIETALAAYEEKAQEQRHEQY